MIILPDAENRMIFFIFIRLIKTPECDGRPDGQTDRQNRSGYYSGLHCEQWGRTVEVKIGSYFQSGWWSLCAFNVSTLDSTGKMYWSAKDRFDVGDTYQ